MFNLNLFRFKPVPLHQVLSDQLYEARRERAAHLASAEHHKALAEMYSARIERLEIEVLASAPGSESFIDSVLVSR